MTGPLKLMMTETIARNVTDETIALLMDNLRDQLLARFKRGGYVVDPDTVHGIVRGAPLAASRQVEVWAMYSQHTPEHRQALGDAYTDGLASARAYRAVTNDEHVPTGEDGKPLTGHAWADYIKALAECPYKLDEYVGEVTGQEAREVEVLAVAWRRGWTELGEALKAGRGVNGAPYLRLIRP